MSATCPEGPLKKMVKNSFRVDIGKKQKRSKNTRKEMTAEIATAVMMPKNYRGSDEKKKKVVSQSSSAQDRGLALGEVRSSL